VKLSFSAHAASAKPYISPTQPTAVRTPGSACSASEASRQPGAMAFRSVTCIRLGELPVRSASAASSEHAAAARCGASTASLAAKLT
jgi:hypothetical protein